MFMRALGIMQGRLSPMVGDKIQAFPADTWREEFPIAQKAGFDLIEWVVDTNDVERNPLFSSEGRSEIKEMTVQFGVEVSTVCADYLLEVPLCSGRLQERLESTGMLHELIRICPDAGIRNIEVPLLLGADITDPDKEREMTSLLLHCLPIAEKCGIRLLIEVGLPPARVAAFIERFPSDQVQINYDLGNSAYFGFDAAEEMSAYGTRIGNVHVKDCTPEDYSVPLGHGNVDFDFVFSYFGRLGFKGDFILQAYRRAGEDPAAAAKASQDFVLPHIRKHFCSVKSED